MMTLPANDAFTLGLPHDPARIGLRSSTKIPFVSSQKARSPSASLRAKHSPARQMSVELHDPPSSPSSRPAATHSPASNGSANGSANGSPLRQRKRPRSSSHSTTASAELARTTSRASSPQQPVDWEIPRKTLHSSIGFLTLYLYASNGNPRTVVIALSLALAVIVPCDILRLRSSRFEWLFERCVGFLMRESEKKHTNGVIWYIIGVIFVLSVYPLDIATVSILILSWADTAASTVGRLLGRYTAPLPRSIPLVPFVPFARLPLAPRKSLAGFIAGSVTGAAIALGFWGWFAPVRDAQLDFHLPAGLVGAAQEALPAQLAQVVQHGVELVQAVELPIGRWIGLGTLGTVCGLISGTAEALDLGSLDDNLTLPIISGGCIWGFFKVLEYFTGSA
ncbi:hypothetical protein OH77DRAFT_1431886 [Trametes cingulata]|nr:hypothetical protein OH77DRAFT_1431886 [Trametes cingulata]